ncbi:MAG: 2-hydroxyacid dehydrogenase [Oscillospiraceae bacterium]
MDTVAFFDTKPYDRKWFDTYSGRYEVELRYLENRLCAETAVLASGSRAVCAFVNDTVDEETIKALAKAGVEAVAMRCAGYNNVDMKAASAADMKIYRVPAYSPEAVAEHAMALLLTLCRKTHKAYNRTREQNFSLKGLEGFNLKGKTVGIVGTGKVGQAFCDICFGFGMKVIAHDPYPAWGRGVEYVGFDEMCRRADIISLHCPLLHETYHLISRHTFHIMKKGVYIINTSRGALIDSEALLEAIKSEKVGGAGLDVYEEESDVFYEDVSDRVIRDDTLNMLLSQPNVLVTSHQGFLTQEALSAIAETTLGNLRCCFRGASSENIISAQPGQPATV